MANKTLACMGLHCTSMVDVALCTVALNSVLQSPENGHRVRKLCCSVFFGACIGFDQIMISNIEAIEQLNFLKSNKLNV